MAPYHRTLCIIAMLATLSFTMGETAAGYETRTTECGESSLTIDGGDPSPFVLPKDTPKTLTIHPDDVITILAKHPPPNGSVRWGLSGLSKLGTVITNIDNTSPVDVALADYAKYGRGVFTLDVAMLSNNVIVCAMELKLKLTGFGGAIGIGSAAATGTTASMALLGSIYSARGMSLKMKVQVRRRHHHGWRRWLPLPAWKRTLVSGLIGCLMGVPASVLSQQMGVAPLSTASIILGLVTGGVSTAGMGIAIGALWTFLRPPGEPQRDK